MTGKEKKKRRNYFPIVGRNLSETIEMMKILLYICIASHKPSEQIKLKFASLKITEASHLTRFDYRTKSIEASLARNCSGIF